MLQTDFIVGQNNLEDIQVPPTPYSGIEIITFDELFERARFIVVHSA
ncbi:MAG: hypothetical protein WBQ89_24480 [Candidatus Acidiferrum sp.]